ARGARAPSDGRRRGHGGGRGHRARPRPHRRGPRHRAGAGLAGPGPGRAQSRSRVISHWMTAAPARVTTAITRAPATFVDRYHSTAAMMRPMTRIAMALPLSFIPRV